MDRGSGGQTLGHCLNHIVGVKLTDCHSLEATCEQFGTSLLELMLLKWTRQWMGRALRMDEDRSSRQILVAYSQGQLREMAMWNGWDRVTEMWSIFLECTAICNSGVHEEGSGGGITFHDIFSN
eukprot:359586-Chlamydomonas_euryale.AAC.2